MGTRESATVTPTAAADAQAGCSLRIPTLPSSPSSRELGNSVPQAPPLPYMPGAQFEIKRHNPPPPLDNGSGYDNPDPKDWNVNPWPFGDGAPEGIVAQYLAHPPRKTTRPKNQGKCNLVVTHQIRCGENCNAQVVRCLVDGKEQVAKIFDPLYIGIEKCYKDGFPPTYFTERFYSCEVAAYKRIKERGLDGKYTPKFGGCWSLELPLPLPGSQGDVVYREVCLILQEFIPGDTIQALITRGEADNIPSETRVDLLDQLMEAFSQLAFIGVRNDDKHPRNYMVHKDTKKGWQIMLIDFSHSRVRDLPNSKWWTTARDREKKLPESPITVLKSTWPPYCDGWIPEECNGRTADSFRERLEHMKKRWDDSPDHEPVDSETFRRFIKPRP